MVVVSMQGCVPYADGRAMRLPLTAKIKAMYHGVGWMLMIALQTQGTAEAIDGSKHDAGMYLLDVSAWRKRGAA